MGGPRHPSTEPPATRPRPDRESPPVGDACPIEDPVVVRAWEIARLAADAQMASDG